MAAARPNEVLPNPDPSTITSSAIDRESRNLEQKLNARIGSIEKAIDVQHDDLVRVPTLLDRAIQSLRELTAADLRPVQVSVDGLRKEVDGMAEIRAIA